MTSLILCPHSHKGLRFALQALIPAARPTHIAEALAVGLGFKTHAAVKAALGTGDSVLVRSDDTAAATRLGELDTSVAWPPGALDRAAVFLKLAPEQEERAPRKAPSEPHYEEIISWTMQSGLPDGSLGDVTLRIEYAPATGRFAASAHYRDSTPADDESATATTFISPGVSPHHALRSLRANMQVPVGLVPPPNNMAMRRNLAEAMDIVHKRLDAGTLTLPGAPKDLHVQFANDQTMDFEYDPLYEGGHYDKKGSVVWIPESFLIIHDWDLPTAFLFWTGLPIRHIISIDQESIPF